MTTRESQWRASHRKFVADRLDDLRVIEGFRYMDLHNDPEDYSLGRLTPEGVGLIALLIRQHRCGRACEQGCAVMHLVWIYEGCPEAGQPILDSMKRNSVTVLEKS